MKKHNKKHWNNFYRTKEKVSQSKFSVFIDDLLKEYINKEECFILDVGCGLGGDTLYFREKGYDAYGIDSSEEAIKKLQENYKGFFEKVDLSEIKDLNEYISGEKIGNLIKTKNTIFYMRFLLHAIDDFTEKNLLEFIKKSSKKGDFFIAEFRTLEDKEIEKVYDDHYRRFIDDERLVNKLVNDLKFDEILYRFKGRGLSIYKDEDPFLCRLVIRK